MTKFVGPRGNLWTTGSLDPPLGAGDTELNEERRFRLEAEKAPPRSSWFATHPDDDPSTCALRCANAGPRCHAWSVFKERELGWSVFKEMAAAGHDHASPGRCALSSRSDLVSPSLGGFQSVGHILSGVALRVGLDEEVNASAVGHALMQSKALEAALASRLLLLSFQATDGIARRPLLEQQLCPPSRSPAHGPCPVLNVAGEYGRPAFGARWEFRSHYAKVLALRSALSVLNVSHPGLDVIFVDGSDVIWADCTHSPHELPVHAMQRVLERIRRRSGARVVIGAEETAFDCPPSSKGCSNVPLPPQWARKVCPRIGFDRPPSSQTSDAVPMLQNLNSGVYGGAVADVLHVVDDVVSDMMAPFARGGVEPLIRPGDSTTDQGAFMKWWLNDRTGSVTLDYCAELVSNLFGMPDMLYQQHGDAKAVARNRSSRRAITFDSRPLCFMHANGGSKFKSATWKRSREWME